MSNWLTDTFSAASTKDDIIKSRSLNITRISGVVVPVVTAIGTAVAELASAPPWNEPTFQRQLFFALLAYVAVITVADILGRAIAAMAAYRSLSSAASLLPGRVAMIKEVAGGPDVSGRVVAFHTRNLGSESVDAEYLFVSDDGKAVEWVKSGGLHPTA